MGYKALYREWRPQTFSDVVGQAHITTTLKNAIKNDRIALHIYYVEQEVQEKLLQQKFLQRQLIVFILLKVNHVMNVKCV